MKKVSNDKLKFYFTEEDDPLSLTRTNWYSDFLINTLQLDKSRVKKIKILDVGCGNGKLLYNLSASGFENINGCDYSALSENKSKGMKDYKVIDLNKQSLIDVYKKGSFDITCCTEVLEHLFDPEGTLNQIIDLTKKNGYILITVPLDLNILARIKILLGQNIHDTFKVGTHIKYFKPKAVIKKMEEHKLKIIQIKYLGLGYGLLDQKLPYISSLLARMKPSLFSSDMVLTLKKIAIYDRLDTFSMLIIYVL
jgi:2-polyprenyl-3-methyl-5-hydroxy-6-metoxy-1,4-benzoquinol methylase